MLVSKWLFSALIGAVFILSGRTVSAQIITGHVPAEITRLHLSPLGRLGATNRLHLVLGLPLRNQATLTNLLEQIYQPTSASFHQYLTPDQFTERFGPTTNDYQAVIDFAKSHGLEISGTHRSRQLLDVRGKVSDIEAAFHVTLQTYRHPTESRTFYAPDVEPTVEAGVPIQEITGINNFATLHPSAHAAKAAGNVGIASGSGLAGLYIGRDFRNAYAPGSSLAGSGQYVGLFESDGYYANDIALYEKFAGYTNVPLQNVLIDGFSGTPGGNNLEVALDIEAAIAMAPALAGVVVFESPANSADWIDILDAMAANTQISQFSSSWGYTGNPDAAFDDVFIKMAVQGQSFFQASGDGDAWTSSIWVPAASPYITAVGGTFLTMSNNGTGYISEKVWNSGDYTTNKIMTAAWPENGGGYWGSGGGFSPNYGIPSWQAAINMTTNHGSTTQRNIPDVAMAAFDVYVVYNNGTTNSYSYGTSAAAPMWAGFTALINQQAAASHKYPAGFLNPTLYAFAGQTNYAHVFHDITSGNNFSAGSPTSYNAVAGYDLCTGLGTPQGTNFLTAMAATLPAEAAPTITAAPTNETVTVGDTASFSLTATGTAPLNYYWQSNTVYLTGQTNLIFSSNPVQLTNSGQQFRCVVSNVVGSVTSSAATLTVDLGAAQAPVFAISVARTNLVISGSNGVAGGTYILLMTTNLMRPISNWMSLTTNILSANGNFRLTATNAFSLHNQALFYLLQAH